MSERYPPGTQYRPQVEADAALTALLGGAAYTAPTMHLFVNDYTPDPATMSEVDLVEADWDTYTPKTLGAWGAHEFGLDGSVSAENVVLAEFTGPTVEAENSVYGYYLKSAGATPRLLMVCRFDQAESLLNVHTVLGVLARVTVPNDPTAS